MKFVKHILNMVSFTRLGRADRRLVFYSEGKNYWPHLKHLIFAVLELSDQRIVYITSDESDPGLHHKHPNFTGFFVGDGWVRSWLFEIIDTDVMVMTMPDIENFHIKRSRYKVHYIYVPHSIVSMHMIYRHGAFDHYDTVFCVGPHHESELRALESFNGKPAKNLVAFGYGRLSEIIDQAGNGPGDSVTTDAAPHILIAPSWGDNAIIETIGPELVNVLLTAGYRVTLRPHPQTKKFYPHAINDIKARHTGNRNFTLEDGVSGTGSLLSSDIMISDWSGVALEYAFGLVKPVIFINTGRKVNNPDYTAINIEPLEVFIREKIGTVVEPDQLRKLPEVIDSLQQSPSSTTDIETARQRYVYNIGCESAFGATEILKILQSADS